MCKFIWTVKLSEPSHPSKQCATVKTHLFAIKTQPHMCPLGSLCREHCHGHRPGRLVLPPRILLFMRAAGRRPQSGEEQRQKGVNHYHKGSAYETFCKKTGHRLLAESWKSTEQYSKWSQHQPHNNIKHIELSSFLYIRGFALLILISTRAQLEILPKLSLGPWLPFFQELRSCPQEGFLGLCPCLSVS